MCIISINVCNWARPKLACTCTAHTQRVLSAFSSEIKHHNMLIDFIFKLELIKLLLHTRLSVTNSQAQYDSSSWEWSSFVVCNIMGAGECNMLSETWLALAQREEQTKLLLVAVGQSASLLPIQSFIKFELHCLYQPTDKAVGATNPYVTPLSLICATHLCSIKSRASQISPPSHQVTEGED